MYFENRLILNNEGYNLVSNPLSIVHCLVMYYKEPFLQDNNYKIVA